MPAAGAIIRVQTANVPLTTTSTTLFPQSAPAGIGIPSTGPGRTGYIGLAIVTIPSFTGLTPGQNVTINVRSGTDPTGTLLGAAVSTNNDTKSFAVPIPAGTQSIFVGSLMNLGSATANGSPSNPITVCLLSLAPS